MSASRRPFRAIYRLQLTPDFGFAAAAARIPYLRDLGVSHLYLSPSLQARRGSTHGYDVVDPTRISEDLGGESAFRALAAAAHNAGLGIVLDIVPNHMAADDANRYWTDESLRTTFFDVDPETGLHRRFFDIDDLVGVRQEDPTVFAETHRLVLGLVGEGLIDALRIDHPDGLTDPLEYLQRLRDGGADTVWVEKILESDEALRDWPVTGTVGYEFLNDVCAVFVDADAATRFTELWQSLSGDDRPFSAVAEEAKLEQATTTFTPEVRRLARLAPTDGGPEALARGVASFPIYRTYVRADRGEVDPADREAVAGAAMIDADVAGMLLGERPTPVEFVSRFQQTTPPVVAKGIEDTAFYRYGRLLSLCDVGGDPGRFGIDVARFHAANLERARRFPRAMLTTMTHDTKRSSDVRARITALTWIGEEWAQRVRTWIGLTEHLRSGGAPDDLERYFLLQTLVGAWPIERERIQGYMEKALREAKRNTNWVEPNPEWEGAVRDFCAALYEERAFLADFEPFAARVARLGDRIALGALVLKLTSPGVPDLYQGDELALRALVDPDNRRPVDWGRYEAIMAGLRGGDPPDDESRKLWLCLQVLSLRMRRPEAFAPGAVYEPLDAGPGVVAFRRGGAVLVAVAVRRDAPEGSLPALGGDWQDVLGGESVSLELPLALDELLHDHGVAVLERVDA